MKSKKIPTIIAITLLSISTAVGIYLVQARQLFRLGASGDAQPNNIRVTNISDQSFTVTWTTSKEVVTYVAWGESSTSQENIANDDIANASFVHSATVANLSASKDYYFKIGSAGVTFDNNGLPWKVATGSTLEAPGGSSVASGSVLKATGEPLTNAIVYLFVSGAEPFSTLTSSSGNFVIPVSSIRTEDLSNYFSMTDDTLIDLTTQGGPAGTSSAQIYFKAVGSIPPMIMGQVHDFKGLAVSTAGNEDVSGQVQANDQTGQAQVSGFSLDAEAATISASTVTIDNITEGEIIATKNPEFFGTGPAGIEISVLLESQATISDTLIIKTNGQWTWNPKPNLAEGAHKFTLSYKDANAITRTLTRNFIVQAASKPAFVASPSASNSATPAPAPISGIDTPMLMLMIMAAGFIVFGGAVFYLGNQ